MVSVSSRTCKVDTYEDSTNLMLDLSTKMMHNKDSNTKTTIVKHNKIKPGSKLSAPSPTSSNVDNDYLESFLTLKTPVGKTHNCSIVFEGLKTKKELKKTIKDKKIKKNKKDIKKNKKILKTLK